MKLSSNIFIVYYTVSCDIANFVYHDCCSLFYLKYILSHAKNWSIFEYKAYKQPHKIYLFVSKENNTDFDIF